MEFEFVYQVSFSDMDLGKRMRWACCISTS